MQTISPLARYQQALEQGEYRPDEVQKAAVTELDRLQQALVSRQQGASSSSPKKGLLGRFSSLFHRDTDTQQSPVQGLYMWGGVGRGKTWIMDLFYQSVPGERKLRLHFHRFMLRVHEELSQLQGHSDPLLIIADRFREQTDLLCFDEFFVSDITDAMLLGTLMEALFDRGITLVATSNIPPDELYRNGLQRARFLPAIEQIKQHCQVMNVDAGIDYRLRALTSAHLWKSPLNDETVQAIASLFKTLSGYDFSNASAPVLEINHRPMNTVHVAQGVLAIRFTVLCGENRSQHDYIALSQQFHTVLLLDVPQLTSQTEDQARRFLAMIDEFYERHVKLVVSAEVALEDIYQGNQLKFEYQRCLSRLQEMQSEEYLRLPHLP
ncbi:cell division protein ZapE [Rosenbergiella australiborealis]|uniref:Cell division protein ZapE n=1 Tax=Rosenbergiella australiborealis TaxID=1544696 RepID=A0ABS5T0G0_9GAMM|nr:cell division protein ZapE [Rosenbergiella australiborealis]MBT0725819.1 cell division protein ZapE [Rosenbergiella australiborealis]